MFSFGIGSSVNRFLIEKMAEDGRGRVGDRAAELGLARQIAKKFYDRIRNPLLTDIRWTGTACRSRRTRSTRSACPICSARSRSCSRAASRRPASGEIIVRGKLGGEPWAQRSRSHLPDEAGRQRQPGLDLGAGARSRT